MANPMFWIDPMGNLAVEAAWREPVVELCLRIREVVGKNVSVTKQPPAKAGGFELRTESPDTRRLNDAS
jgi:hypothetical protein